MKSWDKWEGAKVTKNGIFGFFGEYRFLSNFYPCNIIFNDRGFPSSEHAYIFMKCDPDENNLDDVYDTLVSMDCKEAKKYGQNSIKILSNWNDIKERVMYDVVLEKFRNPDLKERLLSTGNKHLEETNWWGDQVWGVFDGKGKNKLGNVLMSVRNFYVMERNFDIVENKSEYILIEKALDEGGVLTTSKNVHGFSSTIHNKNQPPICGNHRSTFLNAIKSLEEILKDN